MTKHAIKVALISVLIAIFITGVVFVAYANIHPSGVAHLFDDMGIRGGAVTYAEKAYQKSKEIDDLDFLVSVSIKAKNNEKINDYTIELISRSDFLSLAEKKKDPLGYYDYIASQYIISGYYQKIWSEKEIVAKAMTFSKSGYRDSNATQNLILHSAESGDLTTLKEILLALSAYESEGTCPTEAKQRLSTDINNLTELISRLS